jgi:hypothetical protein
MEVADLKPGDILLLSGEKGHLLSKAIMYLTDSPVSHAALSYKSSDQIVEETLPQIRIFESKKGFENRTVFVKRLKNQQKSMDPVIQAAEEYLNSLEPYGKANLIILGLLLLYKKFSPNRLTQKVMAKIFKLIASDLIDFINKHSYPGKYPMVCSQLVYRCYQDAGKDYRLLITKGNLVGASLIAERDNLSILDQTIYQIRRDNSSEFRTFLRAGTPLVATDIYPENLDELAKELIEELQTTEVEPPIELSYELVEAIHHFGQALYLAQTGEESNDQALIQANQLGIPPNVLSFLKVEEAYFITPGDLLSHCENIEEVGIIRP